MDLRQQRFPPWKALAEVRRLRRADENADEENEHSDDDYLERGAEQRSVHVAVPDPGNHGQFDGDDPTATHMA